jgi:hypothetical protein
MAERAFPPGHYSTGTELGVKGEFSDFGLVAAELQLTLPIVEEASPGVQFGPGELATYHVLQYGEATTPTDIAIMLLRSEENLEWFQPAEVLEKAADLPERLKRITGGDGLSEPIPLGRIAMGWDADVPDELRGVTRRLGFGPMPNGRRSGRFLYPRGDVALSYGGKHEPSEELAEFIKEQEKVDPFARDLELDDIVAERDDGEVLRFVAASTSQGLKRIYTRTKY